jgi:hypothetical protein
MSRRGVIATVVGALVVMAALLVAASGEPVPMMTRPATTESRVPVESILPSTFETVPPQTLTTTAAEQGWDPSPFIGLVLALLGTLCVLGALLLLVAALRSLYRRPTITAHHEPTFEIPAVPQELLRSARSRMALLEAGEPRNAIVAAWLDLETSAAATGLARLPAETSSEYTARVIGHWEVDRVRLGDLAALYREARFSTHPLTETHRRRAIDDLEALHDDLERVAEAQVAAGTAGEPT